VSSNGSRGGRHGPVLWLGEAINALLWLAPLLYGGLVLSLRFSDEEVLASIVDTYEPSAWAVWNALLISIPGVLVAAATAWASSGTRRRVALIQVASLWVLALLVCAKHFLLMRHITAITGQTFGGFP
jgi:hypothetical protein